ncbi:protein ERGIC-53-like isoform X2 [Prionailurus iriomotensis]
MVTAGDPQAVWYTRGRGQVGSVLEGLASWDGIGILFDSSTEDTQNSPIIRVLASDVHTRYEPHGDAASGVLGSCRQDFRNLPNPLRVRITYWGQRLRVSLNSGLTPNDLDEVCVDVGPLLLAPGGFFGVSAATGTLADDHDILSFLTFSLSEPDPKPPPPPFLEMEQLRLVKQLEGLRARLALGAREDVIPKLSSEVQEEGKRILGLEETLGRHRQILQALQGLSRQLAQAERQWKKHLGTPGHARPEGAWLGGKAFQKEEGYSVLGKVDSEKRRAVAWALENRLALLQDSAKVSALLRGQRSLLQDLQEMRDAAAHVVSKAQLFYLPVGTKHHFSELAQILGLLQKDLRGPLSLQTPGDPWPQAFPAIPTDGARGARVGEVASSPSPLDENQGAPSLGKAAAKNRRPPGQPPGASSCLRPSIFLFFLLIQTIGFFSYVHFSRQELDKSLQDCLSTGSPPLCPAPRIPGALGILRRQPLSSSIHA